jgi:hypothetical protein
MGYCAGKINYFKESVSLNVIDRQVNRVVWSCTVEENMYDSVVAKKRIEKTVEKIMSRFPHKK